MMSVLNFFKKIIFSIFTIIGDSILFLLIVFFSLPIVISLFKYRKLTYKRICKIIRNKLPIELRNIRIFEFTKLVWKMN